MFVDTREFADDATVQADICVAGAGAAGIALALEFAGCPLRVVILENGGVTAEPEGRGIYQVVGPPAPRIHLDPTRTNYFGGSTNYWNASCRPLDESDFEPRDWIPYSGWPIRRADLLPHYGRAQAVCGLGDSRWYDLDACRPHLKHPPLDVDPRTLTTKVLHDCPVRSLADLHRERIAEARNVRVLLRARALRLTTSSSGDQVATLEASAAGGRRLRVEAGAFVLATGGIENARLLLASRDAASKRWPNDGDLIGRFFSEHWHVDIPLPRTGSHDLEFYDEVQTVGDARVWGQLAISEDLQRRERVPGLSFWFQPIQNGAPDSGTVGRALALTREEARSGSLYADLKLALGDPAEAVAHILRRVVRRRAGGPRDYFMRVQLEQTADPENRLRLSSRLDDDRQPGVDLRLRLAEHERRGHVESLRIATEVLGFDGRRLARQLALRLDAGRSGFFSHHTGTTRMSADPARGVVDADCRVHGIGNLFVCGCSVFPTVGIAPPTLTIVALALRLADHLKRGAAALR